MTQHKSIDRSIYIFVFGLTVDLKEITCLIELQVYWLFYNKPPGVHYLLDDVSENKLLKVSHLVNKRKKWLLIKRTFFLSCKNKKSFC